MRPTQPLRPFQTILLMAAWFAGAVALSAAEPSPVPEIAIERADAQVRLSWPSGPGIFRLQVSRSLPAGEPWRELPAAPLVNGRRELLQPADAESAFYRLQRSAGNPPLIGPWSLAQPSIVVGTNGLIRIAYSDADADLAAFRWVWTNLLGHFESELPAVSLGVTGSEGVLEIPLPAAEFPIGSTSFSVRLVDGTGLVSDPVSFAVDVIGTGTGTAPVVQILAASTESIARPPADSPESVGSWRIALRLLDPDHDVHRLRIQHVDPTGNRAVSESSVPPTAGDQADLSRALLRIDRTTPAGEHQFTLWAIDAAGNLSTPATRSLRVDDASSAIPPSIHGLQPDRASPGETLHLTGTGFDPVPALNTVMLAGIPLRIVSGDTAHLDVELPANATSGDLELITAFGSASLANPVTVFEPLQIVVAPRLHAGESTPLRAAFGRDADRAASAVEWALVGRSDGSDALGSIDGDQNYHAPASLATPVEVTLQADATSPGGLRTRAFGSVRIEPVDLTAGETIDPAQGATVAAETLDVRLLVPPGALASPAAIQLERMAPEAAPSAVAGEATLGAVRGLPDGLRFEQPVRLTLPLTHWRQPGTTLRVTSRRDATSPEVDEGTLATVDASGLQATVWITHFSIIAVHSRFEDLVVPGPVALTRIEPASLLEGETGPVLLEGRDFDPGMRVELTLPDGTVVPPTIARVSQVLNNSTAPSSLGVLIETFPDSSLHERQTHSLRLRVTRRDGSTASIAFAIQGLEEAVFTPGTTVIPSATIPITREWSRIEIQPGAVVRVTSPALLWRATQDIIIGGTLDGTGAPGADGTEALGGAAGLTGGAGGHALLSGARGRPAYFRGTETDAREGRDPFPYDIHAFPSLGLPGLGGSPAALWSPLDAGCYGTYEEFTACYRRYVGRLPSLPRLEQREAYWHWLVSKTLDFIISYSSGWRGEIGLPGSLPPSGDPEEARSSFRGNGGGGGGGSGLGAGPAMGGGAGGEGGASLRLVGRRITVGASAAFLTRGGRGGNGAMGGYGQGSGGGGGGGAGGTLHLLARTAVRLPTSGVFSPDLRGGDWGEGGALFEQRAFEAAPGVISGTGTFPVEANYLYGQSLAGKSKFFIGGPELIEVDDHGTEVTFDSQLRTQQTLLLEHEPGTLGSPLPLERLLLQNSEGSRSIPVTRVTRGTRQLERWPLILAPGINTIFLGGAGSIDTALRRVVLVVSGPDSDHDGVSDPDEVHLGLNPASPDSDGDGILDGIEAPSILAGGATGAPGTPAGGSGPDRDGDGWPDDFEQAFHTDPTSNTSYPRSHATAPGEIALCPTGTQPPVHVTKFNEPDFVAFPWSTVVSHPPVTVAHQ